MATFVKPEDALKQDEGNLEFPLCQTYILVWSEEIL